ncbi:MAG: hypothetical protein JKY56_19390, partial [Kofleriaceae bacterium]|nr:hypothetical protein [Kofleriaceae bacterium]
CDKPRQLAQYMASAQHLVHMHFEGAAVTFETTAPDECYDLLAAICLERDIVLRSLTSPDNNLDSLFDYLTGDSR